MSHRSFFLIPDGFRRGANAKHIPLLEEYRNGFQKVSADISTLFRHYELVGVFIMAKYNLGRRAEDRDPLLTALVEALQSCFCASLHAHQVVVVGDTAALVDADVRFRDALAPFSTNPHIIGASTSRSGNLWLYVCYDDQKYFEELYAVPLSVRQYPRWFHAFRTGCEHGLFRWSALFPGTAQTRVACSESYYRDTPVEDMIKRFESRA